MKWEIDGTLDEVQACVERALDIIHHHEWISSLTATSASRIFDFRHQEIGEVGRIMLSTLPRGRTDVYGYAPAAPTDRWLVDYLPRNIPPDLLGKAVQSLLSVYARQIQENIFELSSDELYRIALSGREVNWGIHENGLDDIEAFRKAREGLDEWRARFHERRKQDFESIVGLISDQIRFTGLGMVQWKDGRAVNLPAINAAENAAGPPLAGEAATDTGKEPPASDSLTKRERARRPSVAKKVALALYLIETENLPRKVAAGRSHTTAESLLKYEGLKMVKGHLEVFRTSPAAAAAFRKSINKSSRTKDPPQGRQS